MSEHSARFWKRLEDAEAQYAELPAWMKGRTDMAVPKWETIFTEKIIHAGDCGFVQGEDDGHNHVECECYVTELWDALVEAGKPLSTDAGALREDDRGELAKAARSLIEVWEESADDLGAEWIGLEKRVIALSEALASVPAAAQEER